MAGVPHEVCLGLALQVLNKFPTFPMDLSYCTPIPMMLAYGPESYTFQTWCEDGDETSSLGKKARAPCLVTRKLKLLAHRGRIDDSSSDRSASLAHSTGSAAPGSMGHSPSGSHSWSRSPSQWHRQSGSQSSTSSSIYSHMTQKGSVMASGSESSSEAETEFQAGSESGVRKVKALVVAVSQKVGMSQKAATHNMAIPVVRLKNPAVRLRSLGVKSAVVPLSQRQQPRRPGQTEKLQSLTPMPPNPSCCQSLTAKTPSKNRKPTVMVLLATWMQTLAHGGTRRSVRASSSGKNGTR